MRIEIDQTQMVCLGQGANRYTIVHPQHPQHCLKLPTTQQQSELNHLEYRAYQQLSIQGLTQPSYFVQCYGLVETNLGQALEVERLFLSEQQPAVSLHQWLQTPSLQQRYPLLEILPMIDDFSNFLITNNLAIFDLNSGNLMLCQHEGQLTLKYVDLKSLLQSKEIIPLSRWFKGMRDRKIQRRAARLKQRITQVTQSE